MRPPLRALALLAATLLVGGALAACGTEGSTGGSGVRIVTTTTQLADFARNVGGDRVSVTQLLQPNTDPHDYEPTPSDVGEVARARVVIANGLGLDDWLDDVVANAGGNPARVTATAGITPLPGKEGGSSGDPHVWMDPDNAKIMVRNIADALAAADPAGEAVYRADAERYLRDVTAMDKELMRRIRAVPPATRKIVTDHDAFGYFAKHYGIEVVGAVIPSLSTAAEPAAKDLVALAETIRREGVRTVFPEASVDPRLERAIADESGARVGAPLYADALGRAGTAAGTYLGMMRTDMDAIIDGIGRG
jgi:ABC-type Zn uptake system ZnuABC Zn-binding protein ZnuA